MSDFLSPFHANKLIGMDLYFENLLNFYKKKKFPKVLLLSGKKGSGKFTLIVHFLNFIFSENTYNTQDKSFELNSPFHQSLINGLCENVIFFNNKNNIKIEDIRNLKSTIQKTSITNQPRFFVLDDIEKYNINSSNALLKVLEEPSSNNYFILIDNQENDIIETISSRALKINIFLKKEEKEKIIKFIAEKHEITNLLKFDNLNISPGLYLSYNSILLKNELNVELSFPLKLEKLLNLYKKNKDRNLIGLSTLLTEQYFHDLNYHKMNEPFAIFETRDKIINFINDFVKYNLNLKSVCGNIKAQFINAK